MASHGSSNAFVIISFTLPTQLTNIQALPGSTMPITFSAVSAIWRRATNNPSAARFSIPRRGWWGVSARRRIPPCTCGSAAP